MFLGGSRIETVLVRAAYSRPKITERTFCVPGDADMTNNDEDKHPDSVAFHLVAIVAGLVMMVLGLGLGVTMVLLPLGLVIGLAGLVVLVWGLTPGWRR
jgi:hypothetical protein